MKITMVTNYHLPQPGPRNGHSLPLDLNENPQRSGFDAKSSPCGAITPTSLGPNDLWGLTVYVLSRSQLTWSC